MMQNDTDYACLVLDVGAIALEFHESEFFSIPSSLNLSNLYILFFSNSSSLLYLGTLSLRRMASPRAQESRMGYHFE